MQAWWRRSLWALAVLHVVAAVLLLPAQGFRLNDLYEPDLAPLILAGLLAAGWCAEHMRRGLAPALLALAALAGSVLFAITTVRATSDHAGTSDTMLAAVQWGAYALPAALLLAHDPRRTGALAASGAALVLAGVGMLAGRAASDPTAFRSAGAEVALQLLGSAAIATALVLAARRAPALPAPRGRVPAGTLLALLLLALSWGLGGQLALLIPLWILAPLALALPTLTRPRARPVGALLALALLVAGALLPASECTYPYVTDAPRPDDPRVARVETESVWKVMGRGPWWTTNDLFSVYRVHCEPAVPAIGAVWLVALTLLGAGALPEPRRRAPDGDQSGRDGLQR